MADAARTLYCWATPNSQRVSTMLEELGLTHEARPLNIRAREQVAPEVVALNPDGKIPILLEPHAPPLFESGAILVHLAETHGCFLPPLGDPARAETLAWLMAVLALRRASPGAD